jgi:hypothetical protein
MSHLVRTALGRIEYRSVGQGPAVLVLNGRHTNRHLPLEHEAFLMWFSTHDHEIQARMQVFLHS